MEFPGYVGYDARNNVDHFGDVPLDPCTQDLFFHSRTVSKIARKRMNKFSCNFQDMSNMRQG